MVDIMGEYVKTEDELLGHLLVQIAFLERSASWYDNGAEEEAIRLAIAIRILVHDTNNSKSLLIQLNKKGINFYDSAVPYIPNAFQTPCLTGIRMSTSGSAEYKAPLDDRNMVKIDFKKWWEDNVIFEDMAGNRFTRKDLVLNVADKDGGAHVDPKLQEAYANLSRFNLTGLKLYVNRKQRNFKNTPVLPSIRQIAHEVLKTLKDEFPKLFQSNP